MKENNVDKKIFDCINNNEQYTIHLFVSDTKEDIEKKKSQLEVQIRCLPEAWPIDYKRLKETSPVEYIKLYNEENKAPTLEGFITELTALYNNNCDKNCDARQKVINGTSQYYSYVDALKMLEDTAIVQNGHLYAKTFNYIQKNTYILQGSQVEQVRDLLKDVIATAPKVSVRTAIMDNYAMPNEENIRDFFE